MFSHEALPDQYSLHSIQLAVFGNNSDVQLFVYERFHDPLIKDIQSLEQEGVFVEALDKFVKGTVFGGVQCLRFLYIYSHIQSGN